MPRHLTKIELRLHLLWRLLRDEPNTRIDHSYLSKKISEHLKDDEIEWFTMKAMFVLIREEYQKPGVKIVIHDAEQKVELVLRDETPIEEQRRAYPDIKKNLGAILWHFLFNLALPPTVQISRHSRLSKNLNRKIPALQRKSTVSIAVDAGSTTEYAISQLLEVPQIPIKVQLKKGALPVRDDDTEEITKDLYRFIVPTITTNSISIANVVIDSPHRRQIQMRLVGGELRLSRKSICGSLSELCMQQWNTRMDVALIGTTSFLPSTITSVIPADQHPAFPAFACDDVSEAWLKASFLERSWLRILILDSGKLLKHEGTSVFAPLSNAAIDLVVIDDGSQVDAERGISEESEDSVRRAVQEFLHLAAIADVPVIVLKTPPFDNSQNNEFVI